MEVNVILANYIEIIKQIYGSNLEKIILFGSYARGDNKTFFKSRLETDEAVDILKDFQKAVLENDSMSTEKILNLIK